MKNKNGKTVRFIRWIPLILLALFLVLLIVNATLSDGARDIMTAVVNVCLYVFAAVSFLAAVVSCVLDVKRIVTEKSGKPVFTVLLSVFGILLWILILSVNNAFSV